MTKESFLLASILTIGTSSVFAQNCTDVKVDFTFYGAPDKSYIVTKNTFTDIKATFVADKLEGATAQINLLSIDTSADLNNKGAQWPPAMAKVRDNNTKNSLFKKYTTQTGKATAKVLKVNKESVDVEITMNGVTEKISMATKTEDDTTTASGKLDIAKFGPKAWQSFEKICKGFHRGKSWSEVDLNFYVPSSCK
ncbi:MAG: YceI family protein [Epsilonproteobacteria bacterium]|nr:YceI family protein [Campylobacterota bacterium]